MRERERVCVFEVFAGMEGLRVTRTTRRSERQKKKKNDKSCYFGFGEEIVFCVHLILSVLGTCMHAANLRHVYYWMFVKMSPVVIED